MMTPAGRHGLAFLLRWICAGAESLNFSLVIYKKWPEVTGQRNATHAARASGRGRLAQRSPKGGATQAARARGSCGAPAPSGVSGKTGRGATQLTSSL